MLLGIASGGSGDIARRIDSSCALWWHLENCWSALMKHLRFSRQSFRSVLDRILPGAMALLQRYTLLL